MTKDEFFTPSPAPDRIAQWRMDKDKLNLAKHGYAHEDATLAKKLRDSGRTGYLVYRFAIKPFSYQKSPSLVHGASLSLTHGKERAHLFLLPALKNVGAFGC